MEKTQSTATPFILGVDLGTNSLGWALIGLNAESPAGLIRCGARVFDATRPFKINDIGRYTSEGRLTNAIYAENCVRNHPHYALTS